MASLKAIRRPRDPHPTARAVVEAAGPVDTVAVHLDLDGLYSGAKWVLGGVEPYDGADADARAVDTRRGKPGPIATRIDRALRALRTRVVERGNPEFQRELAALPRLEMI